MKDGVQCRRMSEDQSGEQVDVAGRLMEEASRRRERLRAMRARMEGPSAPSGADSEGTDAPSAYVYACAHILRYSLSPPLAPRIPRVLLSHTKIYVC